jgi:hypothetical protein
MTNETFNKDPETGRFLPGNSAWKARSSHGRNPKFSDPDHLWNACCEYFEWVDNNPLWEDKITAYQGEVSHSPIAKMRAMTISGLCIFLDILPQTWLNWKNDRPDFLEVISRVENIIRDQKFSGAAADLLNANIIARDLGLADKSEITGKDGAPLISKIEYEIVDPKNTGSESI